MQDLVDDLKYLNNLLKEYQYRDNETMMKNNLLKIIKNGKEVK